MNDVMALRLRGETILLQEYMDHRTKSVMIGEEGSKKFQNQLFGQQAQGQPQGLRRLQRLKRLLSFTYKHSFVNILFLYLRLKTDPKIWRRFLVANLFSRIIINEILYISISFRLLYLIIRSWVI